jgi:predicted GTPase
MKILYLNFLKNVEISKIDHILSEALSKTNFIFNFKQTYKYRKIVPKNQLGFAVEKTNDNNKPLFFFASFIKNKFELVNIVPLNNDIEEKEYVELTYEIYHVMKELNIKNLKIKYFDNADDLSKIVTSKMARERLENIIKNFPNSYHPNDLKNIDTLACVIHSYSRKEIDFDILKEYLNKNSELTKEYTEYLLNRIKIGLQVLSVYTGQKYFL